ncbi:hypothetical protein R1flu_006951 [Riccia fluitans]|uniref:Uncharacterized protein n=1 Tax=Riccia fluitans TaxID=41844 RepID=A0ABD1Z0H8_9MARC
MPGAVGPAARSTGSNPLFIIIIICYQKVEILLLVHFTYPCHSALSQLKLMLGCSQLSVPQLSASANGQPFTGLLPAERTHMSARQLSASANGQPFTLFHPSRLVIRINALNAAVWAQLWPPLLYQNRTIDN